MLKLLFVKCSSDSACSVVKMTEQWWQVCK